MSLRLVLLFCFLVWINGAPARAETIVFLVDHPEMDERIQLTFDIEQEIKAVSDPRRKWVFQRFYGSASYTIQEQIERLYAQAHADVVIAIGPVVSHEVTRREQISIPTLVTGIIDERVQALPQVVSGGSGRANLHYLSRYRDIEDEIEKLRSLVPFSHIAILVSPELMYAIPALARFNLEKQNYRISVHILAQNFAELDQLPSDIDAIYFTPHFAWSQRDIERLAEHAVRLDWPAFSYLASDLPLGFLATVGNEKHQGRFIRRIALNVDRILSGTPAERLPIAFEQRSQMMINMAIARRLGISPSWSLLTNAKRINALPESIPHITLQDVAFMARDSNLEVKIDQQAVIVAEREADRAKSALLPQVAVSVSGVSIDGDRAGASFGAQSEHQMQGQLRISQTVYSESQKAALDIARQLVKKEAVKHSQTERDAIYNASIKFINVLQLQAEEKILEKNYQFTRQNVELAETRQRIGVTGPADLYRWQSQLVTQEQELNRVRTQLQQGKIVLQHSLHQPLTLAFVAAEPELHSVSLVLSQPDLAVTIRSPAEFEYVIQYVIDNGLMKAPELAQIDAALAVQKRALQASRRAFWVPEIGLQSDVIRTFSTSGAGSDFVPPVNFGLGETDDVAWSVALHATLPLYTGGARRNDKERIQVTLSQLRDQRRALHSALEMRIRNAMYQMWNSYSNMDLARQAATSSKKNYDLVKGAYSQGVVAITQLLDAQKTALSARLGEENSRYQFLHDLLSVQRVSGSFYFILTEAEQSSVAEDLRSSLKRIE